MALKKPTSVKTPARAAAPTATSDATSAEPHGNELDRYDIALLHELQRDARLSNTELAARIGLSAAPTWRRVKWLEEQGYITATGPRSTAARSAWACSLSCA
jgi:Lrp/AsnC family transcriptional regulator, leucine-responsive regulatory protein